MRVRRLAQLLDDAADKLEDHDEPAARDLRRQAWDVALTNAPIADRVEAS
jgi:hypothetical protein